LTGGTETARLMLQAKPSLQLMAETGGKNATIITALADRELAIKHLLHSAFGHAGQKCSATSLLLLEEEVYDDPEFRRLLVDAVQSLPVGSAWELSTRVGPLIRPPDGPLLRGLKELEHGEEWLVMSEQVGENPCLYRPCVKWGVTPDSFTHTTELFGPVLGVMKFRRLEEAVERVNRTGYGLTSGLESLDDREQTFWAGAIHAGNLYINRSTTGAVVLRQPFGGMGKSAWGPGVKAGGPHYVVPLLRIRERPAREPSVAQPPNPPAGFLTGFVQRLKAEAELAAHLQPLCRGDWLDVLVRLRVAAREFTTWAETEYGTQHDAVLVVGQDNLRRYRPVDHLRFRLTADCCIEDILVAVFAAVAVGCRPVLSICPKCPARLVGVLETLTHDWGGRIELVEEDSATLADQIRRGFVDRIRGLEGLKADAVVLQSCREAFVPIIDEPIIASGRIEPLWYLQEQSLSVDYHRYGNLGRRAGEMRRAVD
jgi:RHH-type proline utilization regulon transcriptional repressor/proline dehydrogenase/delta 1-pyrroline-5-carboxylate dehydrogenase